MAQQAYRESTARREAIKRSLSKSAAEVWGTQGVFDPLVDLLFGACATEFEKTERQIQESEKHLLQRLANLLLPEVSISPLPAHAIAQAKPVEAIQEISTNHQFAITKEITHPQNPLQQQAKELVFTPVVAHQLLQAHVQCIATTQHIAVFKENLLQEKTYRSAQAHHHLDTCWLGIALSDDIDHFTQIALYFDWKNLPEKHQYLPLFRQASWSHQQSLLNIRQGFPSSLAGANDLMMLIDPSKKIEQQILQQYQAYFVHFNIAHEVNLSPFPEELSGCFTQGSIDLLKEPLMWIKVQLHESVPAPIFEELICATNCFPVMNRRLETAKRPHRVNKKMNMLPLKSDDFFLAVHQVHTDGGKIFEALPMNQYHEGHTYTYSVRHEGISRFDDRNATEALEHLLDTIRDEKAAFESLGGHRLLQELKTLQQSLSRLESIIDLKKTYKDVTHYLLLNVERDENVWVSFWTTTALLANNLLPGTLLKAVQNADFKNNEAILLTETKGGRNKAEDREKIYNYRSTLLSRDRLVTQEDLRAACFAKLGKRLIDVVVKKGIAVGKHNNQGLIRTVEVLLHLSPDESTDTQEWTRTCQELQQYLQQNATIFSNICVKVA